MTTTSTPRTNVTNMATPTTEELLAQIKLLSEQNTALKQSQATNTGLGIKISEKGCISVYGLGRFPVSLYRDGWIKLIAKMSDIEKFMADNKAKLDTFTKPTKTPVVA